MATGWLEKRSKDGWTIIINHGRQLDPKTGTVKQIRKSYSFRNVTKAEAQAKLHEMLAEINKGTYVEPIDVTLGEYLDKWLRGVARPRVSDRTYEDYEGQVRNHIKPLIGHLRMVDVHPDDIRGLYASMRQAGISPSTIRHTHVILNSAFRQSIEDRDLVYNPVSAVDAPKVEPKRRRALTDEEVSLLLTHAFSIGRPRQRDGIRWLCSFYELYRTALASGLRRGELLALRKSALDLSEDIGILHVTEAVSSVKVEDGKRTLKRKPPKSERGERDIPIDAVTTQMLRGLCDRNPYDLVFCRTDGSPLDPSTISRTFKRVARQAGIPDVSFHCQRHTFVTNLIALGVDPFTVQDMAGHANISTTRIYVHTADERKKEAAVKLGLALPNSGEQQITSKNEQKTRNTSPK